MAASGCGTDPDHYGPAGGSGDCFDHGGGVMAELKPCPFCGGDKIQFIVNGYFQPWEKKVLRLWYHCSCHECGASMDTGSCTDMKKALLEWNRRAEDGKTE